jgi:hypothetical protein
LQWPNNVVATVSATDINLNDAVTVTVTVVTVITVITVIVITTPQNYQHQKLVLSPSPVFALEGRTVGPSLKALP